MLAEVLWICPKCGALVMSVDRKLHRRWHKRLGTRWSVLPKKSWDVWEKKEKTDE